MSYYSDTQYKPKESPWFEGVYFARWFQSISGPILDIGCAAGNFIAVRPKDIEGIDIDDDSLRLCRERGFSVRKLNIEKEAATLQSEYYAGVYAKQVIEHMHNPLGFMRSLHRILKPNGVGIILTPNCPYALSRFFWDDYTHVRPLTRESLSRLALDAGFVDFKIYEDFRCFRGVGFLMRTFNLSPELISKVQRFLFIPGLSLILEVKKAV